MDLPRNRFKEALQSGRAQIGLWSSLSSNYTVEVIAGPFKGMKLQDAVDQVIHKELEALHGDGGVIAITPDGQLAWSFNTPGMFRAKLVEGGQVQMGIYTDEP